jgi:segregation and condensation protein B
VIDEDRERADGSHGGDAASEPLRTEDPEAPANVEDAAADVSPHPVTQPGDADSPFPTICIPGDSQVVQPQTGEQQEQPVEVSPEISDDPDAPADVEEIPPELLTDSVEERATEAHTEEARMLAVLEAIVYVTDEPLSAEQIARGLGVPLDEVRRLLAMLVAEYNRPEHGLTVREVAGGYKMATRPEHHEAVRTFVKNLNPPLKLSLAALETLAVIAYKQPITAPEIMEIRGVQGAGVLKTLLDRKLISSAGRKNVVGKPILYKTTKDFLVQFGLRDLAELPTLKEFEELRRMAFSDSEEPAESSHATDGAQTASPKPEETATAGSDESANTPHE